MDSWSEWPVGPMASCSHGQLVPVASWSSGQSCCSGQLLDVGVARQSVCELEVDVVAADILNHQRHSGGCHRHAHTHKHTYQHLSYDWVSFQFSSYYYLLNFPIITFLVVDGNCVNYVISEQYIIVKSNNGNFFMTGPVPVSSCLYDWPCSSLIMPL